MIMAFPAYKSLIISMSYVSLEERLCIAFNTRLNSGMEGSINSIAEESVSFSGSQYACGAAI